MWYADSWSKIWQSPKRLVDFCIFVSIQKYNPYWKMYKMFTLECQINVIPPPLVNFFFSIPPIFVWTLHVFVIPNIFFTCLDRNWGSQYKHFSIKISVIKYEENVKKIHILAEVHILFLLVYILNMYYKYRIFITTPVYLALKSVLLLKNTDLLK